MKKLLSKILCLLIISFTLFIIIGCDSNPLSEAKSYVIKNLNTEVTSDLYFVTEYKGVNITYSSKNKSIIADDGQVTRGDVDQLVDILITFNYNGEIDTYTYTAVVRATEKEDPQVKINEVKKYISSLIPTTVVDDLEFIYEYSGVNISYSSNKTNVLTNTGQTIKQTVDTDVVLTINFTYMNVSDSYVVYLVVVSKDLEKEDYINLIEEDVLNSLNITNNVVTGDLTFKTNSLYDSIISWQSSNENIISSDGKVAKDVNGEKVTLTFKINYQGNIERECKLDLIVITQKLDYYSAVTAISGTLLKKELRSVITKSHKKILTYNDLRVYTAKTDVDPNNPNNIILFYSRKSVSSKWDGGGTWNREHIWPQSTGWFKTSDAGADIHHVRPTNPSINSSRGNKPYGVTTNSKTFEPDDAVKGDVARIIFYLLVRYQEADNYKVTATASSMEMLLEWNKLDPVDNLERTRNEEAYNIQGNRNPFIDNYLYADMIWAESIDLTSNEFTVSGFYLEVVNKVALISELERKNL